MKHSFTREMKGEKNYSAKSSTEVPLPDLALADVLLDNVLNSVPVLKEFKSMLLGRPHLFLNHFRPLQVGLDELLHFGKISQVRVGCLVEPSPKGIKLFSQLHLHVHNGLHLRGEVVHFPTVNLLEHLTLIGQFIHRRPTVLFYLQ